MKILNLKKEKNEKNSKVKCAIKIICVVILTALITYFATIKITLKSYLNSSNNTIYLATKLNLIKQKLQSEYIYDIDESKMIEDAVKGYVQGVDDKYTQYLSKEDMQDLL